MTGWKLAGTPQTVNRQQVPLRNPVVGGREEERVNRGPMPVEVVGFLLARRRTQFVA